MLDRGDIWAEAAGVPIASNSEAFDVERCEDPGGDLDPGGPRIVGGELGGAASGVTADSMAMGRSGSLSFGIQKRITISMPQPFTKPGELALSLGVEASGSLAMQGSFDTALQLPGLVAPVSVRVTASMATSAAGSMSMALLGETTSPIAFQDFSFITFDSLAIGAQLSLSPKQAASGMLLLSGSATIFNVKAKAAFALDPFTKNIAFNASMERFDLQALIRSYGGSVDVSAFDLVVTDAQMAYATADIPALQISQGWYLGGKMSFLGMAGERKFMLSKTGVKFNMTFDFTELSKVGAA